MATLPKFMDGKTPPITNQQILDFLNTPYRSAPAFAARVANGQMGDKWPIQGPPTEEFDVGPKSLPPEEAAPLAQPAQEEAVSSRLDPEAIVKAFQLISSGEAAKPKRGGRGSGYSPVKVGDAKLEALPGQTDTDADSLVKGGRRKQSELDAASKLLQDKADKEPGTADVISQLLVGLLPGLLGLAVGGAVGGTSGALAGAGGGFTGSAEGLNRIQKNDQDKRDKLTGRAQKLQDRIDELEKQIGVRKDRLEDRDLTVREATKQRNQMAQLQAEKAKETASLQAQRINYEANENRMDRNLKAEDIARQDRESMREALLKATNNGVDTSKLTDSDKKAANFARRMAEQEPDLKGLAGLDRATLAGALQSTGFGQWFADPEQQKLAVAAKIWANAMLRQDSGAAVPEIEVERAFQSYIPLGSDKPETVKFKERKRREEVTGMAQLSGGAAGLFPQLAPYLGQSKPQEGGGSFDQKFSGTSGGYDAKYKVK
jgi:hypothetical protein